MARSYTVRRKLFFHCKITFRFGNEQKLLMIFLMQANNGLSVLPTLHCVYDDDSTVSEQSVSEERKNGNLLLPLLYTSAVAISHCGWWPNL